MYHSLSAYDVGQRKLNSRTSRSLGESDPWKPQPKVFSSNTRGVVAGFYELWSEALFLPKPLVCVSCGRGILFISQRGKKNRLICDFMTWKVDLFGRWEVSLPNAALLGRTQDVLAKMNNVLQLVLESVETQPRRGLHWDCISILHLYYSCYTNQFFLLRAHASVWFYPDSPHLTHAFFLTVSNMKKTHGR